MGCFVWHLVVIAANIKIGLFGNKYLLRAEERTEKNNQYEILKKAGISIPKQFSSAKEIDRMCIVKMVKENSFERKFFLCASEKEFEENAKQFTEQELSNAVIEEFVLGAQVNFNYFYSPINKELELIGTDTRRQTSLDGFLRLFENDFK